MDYPVIEDKVNLGARLESLTRQYNNHIIISEYTFGKVRNFMTMNELGAVAVKGKQQSEVISDLVALKGSYKF